MRYALAIVITFSIVGALHDVFVIANEGTFRAPGTTWFALVGAVVVGLEILANRLRVFGIPRRLRTLLERTVFLAAASSTAAFLRWYGRMAAATPIRTLTSKIVAPASLNRTQTAAVLTVSALVRTANNERIGSIALNWTSLFG